MADPRLRLDEPIYGFRAWVADRNVAPPRLLATTFDMPWVPAGVNEARCLVEIGLEPTFAAWGRRLLGLPEVPLPRHPAPAANCGCGFYAYDSLDAALRYASSARWPYPWRPGPHNLFVLGAVLLWGESDRRVQVGDLADGAGVGRRIRAPFARVLALLDPGRADDTAHEVGPALGLPVVPVLGLELYAREHGARLPIPGQEVTT